jgi:2-dehydropantoate 2-reductase
MVRPTKVLILGAGALGSLLGALLQDAGHEPLLIGRPGHVRAVALDGLRLTGGAYGPPRRVPLRAATQAPSDFTPELIILAVKTQDVVPALRENVRALGDAPIVALQNGLAQDALVAAAVGEARAVAAVAVLDAEYVEDGHVDCARRGTLVVGAPFAAGAAAAESARGILVDALRVKPTANVAGARWTKLLVNLSNAIPAITGLSYQDASRHEGLARANVRMIREALAVVDAERVRLASLPWTSPLLLRAAGSLPEPIAARLYAARVRRVLGTTLGHGSTWQSVQRGRPTEIAWLNGEVARRGALTGVATPVNAMAVALVEKGARLTADEAVWALLRGSSLGGG